MFLIIIKNETTYITECDNLKRSIIFVIDSTFPKRAKHVGRRGDVILQRRNSLCTLRRRISVAQRWIRVRTHM